MNNWHLVHYAYANSPKTKGDAEVVWLQYTLSVGFC